MMDKTLYDDEFKINVLCDIARRMTENLTIKIEYGGNEYSYTDGKRIVINQKAQDAGFNFEKCVVYHESNHIAFKSFDFFMNDYENMLHKKYVNLSVNLIRSMINIVEDLRVNFLGNKIYPGFNDLLCQFNKKIMTEFMTEKILSDKKEQLTVLTNMVISVLNNQQLKIFEGIDDEFYKIILELRDVIFNNPTIITTYEVTDVILKEIEKRVDFDMLKKEPKFAPMSVTFSQIKQDTDDLKDDESDLESLGMLKERDSKKKEEKELEDLKKELTEKLEKSDDEAESSDVESDDLDGEDEMDELGDDDISETGKVLKEKKDKEEKDKKERIRKKKETLKDELKEVDDDLDEIHKDIEKLDEDLTEKKDEMKKEHEKKIDDIIAREGESKKLNTKFEYMGVDEYHKAGFYTSIQQVLINNAEVINQMKNKLSQIINDDNRYHTGYRYGSRINANRIVRSVASGYTDNRPFMQKTIPNRIYVTLMVDLSGSMRSSSLIEPAREAVFTFAEAIKDIVYLRIVGFTGYKLKATNIIFKDFDDVIDYHKLNKIDTLPDPRLQNLDGVSILEEAKILSSKPGKNIILVISDGIPASQGYGLQDAISDIQCAQKLTKIFAFSLEARGGYLQQLYQNNYTNCRRDDIKDTLLSFTDMILKELSK